MIDDLIERYIKLRDLKDARKKHYEEEVADIERAMGVLEGHLAEALTAANVDRMGCKSGIVFFQTSTSATVQDAGAFFDFLREGEHWELADIRAAKKAIAEWKDEHAALPPGINWREARVVRVNRPR